MSRGLESVLRLFEGFPRVSGDEPHMKTFVPGEIAFSPRERG